MVDVNLRLAYDWCHGVTICVGSEMWEKWKTFKINIHQNGPEVMYGYKCFKPVSLLFKMKFLFMMEDANVLNWHASRLECNWNYIY